MDAFHLKIAVDEFTKSPLSEDEFYNRYSNSWLQTVRGFIKKTWSTKATRPYRHAQNPQSAE